MSTVVDADAPEITALLALVDVVGESPDDAAGLKQVCRERLAAAEGRLKAQESPRALPLIIELCAALDSLGERVGASAAAVVSEAMGRLPAVLELAAGRPDPAELAVISDLRSVRGASPLWHCALFDLEPGLDMTEGGGRAGKPPGVPNALAQFRKHLLKLLKSDSSGGAQALAAICDEVADGCHADTDRQLWRSAAALFRTAWENGQDGRASVKRTAVRLEQALKRLHQPGSAEIPAEPALLGDMRVLCALFERQAHGPETAAGTALAVRAHAERLNEAIEALAASPAEGGGRILHIADALLVEGRGLEWLEAREMIHAPAHALAAAVSGWRAPPVAQPPQGPDPSVSAHFSETAAKLRRVAEAETDTGVPGTAPVLPGGIPVDETLLDNLDLMAAEIRGARSRAEANLGNLRGGLVDMERTIRQLRDQLEGLELTPAGGAADPLPAKDAEGMQSRLSMLSRGIEELAGLKDALEALTEDTESVLAGQAGGDTRLAQGLLKTRLAPVGHKFDGLAACVARAAAESGVEAGLVPRGGEVELERSQMEALEAALAPLLEACVRKGLAGAASPARDDGGPASIELAVTQPGFDVRLDLVYAGAPLPGAELAALIPALERAGAVCTRELDATGRVRIRLVLPGPPQARDLLLVDVGGGRFGIPLEAVAGVMRPPPEARVPEGEDTVTFEAQEYRVVPLVQALRMDAPVAPGAACVLVQGDGRSFAYLVDTVVGRERMLVRSPGPLLGANPWIFGAVFDELAAPTLVLNAGTLRSCPPQSKYVLPDAGA